MDGELLAAARMIAPSPDSQFLDASLRALLRQHRSTEIDAQYSAYDEVPMAASDEWGDLESWHRAADASRQ